MKYVTCFVVLMILLAGTITPADAQGSDFHIHLGKDFGYAWGSTIQGRFTIRVIGDDSEIDRVTFFIDEGVLGEADSKPFRLSFNTGDFSPGTHQLRASVYLKDGRIQTTSSLSYHFLSAAEANRQLTRILLGLGGAVAVIILLVAGLQILLAKRDTSRRRAQGASHRYGILGGTICPKCGSEFPRHLYGLNLLVGRLDRCEHCGRWVMTTRATPAALRRAEENQSGESHRNLDGHDPKTDRRDMLEETKFIDHI